MKTRLFLVLFILFPFNAWSGVIHVPTDQPTIQAGIDTAQVGDTVLVANELYAPSTNGEVFPIKIIGRDGISLQAEGGATLDSEESVYDDLLYISNSNNITVDGFAFQFSRRKGLYCRDSEEVYVIGCYFLDNQEGALSSAWSTFFVYDCELENTEARDANGLSGWETHTVAKNNIVHGFHTLQFWNVAGMSFSGRGEPSTATLINNIVYDNDEGVYGNYTEMTVLNNTIDSNIPLTPSDLKGRGLVVGPTDLPVLITNNIVTNHTNDGVYLYQAPDYILSHNNAWNNATLFGTQYDGCEPGTGDISVDPLFIGAGDYHLSLGSPCIDAGTDAGIYTDIDGDTRPQGGGFDIGADEVAQSCFIGTVM